MKTSELIGPALDWAVAKCEGTDWLFEDLTKPCPGACYSTDWAQGGPIIEREGIGTRVDCRRVDGEFVGWWFSEDTQRENGSNGPTMLVAAMRCYVASKLGDEVEIPEELT